MTRKQRELLAELGPYTLRKDGAVIDTNGVALCSLRPNASAEECAWDIAVVAALNEVVRAYNAEKEVKRLRRAGNAEAGKKGRSR